MSSYYEAMKQSRLAQDRNSNRSGTEHPNYGTPSNSALVKLPVAHPTPVTVAQDAGLQRVCEQLSPMAVIGNDLRLLVTGCRPGDGASTIAAAFALDFSQRLSLRTLLVDGNARRPTLHRSFARANGGAAALRLDGLMQIRSTGWAWLDLATSYLGSTEEERREALQRCNEIARDYAAIVIDLGVVRLDARTLPLARESDPILLIARYGATRRHELATTAAALRGAKRSAAGVILNAVANPITRTTGKVKQNE